MSRSTTSHVALCAGILLAITVPLTGCSGESDPTVVETPEIEWQDGPPADEGRFVDAARAADLGFAIAYNAHDFTVAQLTDSMSREMTILYYEAFEPAHLFAIPGPSPATVISVTENATGAEVILCEFSVGWAVSADDPEPRLDLTAGTETTYTVVTAESGDLIVDHVQPSGLACDATGAAVGYFEPAPTIPQKLTKSDVRAPLGYED